MGAPPRLWFRRLAAQVQVARKMGQRNQRTHTLPGVSGAHSRHQLLWLIAVQVLLLLDLALLPKQGNLHFPLLQWQALTLQTSAMASYAHTARDALKSISKLIAWPLHVSGPFWAFGFVCRQTRAQKQVRVVPARQLDSSAHSLMNPHLWAPV